MATTIRLGPADSVLATELGACAESVRGGGVAQPTSVPSSTKPVRIEARRSGPGENIFLPFDFHAVGHGAQLGRAEEKLPPHAGVDIQRGEVLGSVMVGED